MLEAIETCLEQADIAQQVWANEIVRRRAHLMGDVANLIAARYQELIEAIERPGATAAEKLASEIIPLADACRFSCLIARRTLAPKASSVRIGAWWLGRVSVQTLREPWGTVLILAPSNYPLYLPGVQAIQALVAGNAVVVKPAPGHVRVMQVLSEIFQQAGLPSALFQVLPDSVEAATQTMRCGVDKVVLTGSFATGRAVLRELAEKVTPAVMELSGCDAVFVLPKADIVRTAKSISYGLQLNGGRTCIAPRRIFVTPDNLAPLQSALCDELAAQKRKTLVAPEVFAQLRRTVAEATAAGATILLGELPAESQHSMGPLVLTNVTQGMKIARSDIFAPVTNILPVASVEEAIVANRQCPYSLGAAIFGPTDYASYVAHQISAGCVVINDMIAPTADPRVAFGGRNQSGWGVTRGAEGLLEMTQAKTICTRKGKWLPHLDEQMSQDEQSLISLLQIFHAKGMRNRWKALVDMIQRARKK